MKQQKNYYKITTYVLIGIVVIAAAIWGFGSYSKSKFTQGALFGQAVAVDTILQNIKQTGQVSIYNEELNLTLVPVQYIQVAQEQVILEVINQVAENGYVSLYSNETEVILVPYQPPEQ